jgi:hypothetical protein
LRPLVGRPLALRPLVGRSLALRPLVGRSLTLRALRALILRSLTLRSLTLRSLILRLLRLSGGTLLRLPAPLLLKCAHLRVILILLVATEHAHDLAAQLAARAGVARTSLRMSLRILIDHRLYALLLIAGKVEIAEPFHPATLNLRRASSRALLGRSALWLTLLGVGAERRYCERDHERARCQKGGLHGHDLTL